MHPKEGQPGAAISHESRPGKPSFCTFDTARDYSFSSGTDNSSNNGLGKPMGFYPNHQHEMLSRNEAQQRPGHRPSASQAFHPLLLAQTVANEKMTPQPRQNQPGAPTAAEGSAGISGTTCTRLIPGGPPSPSPLSSTTQPDAALPQQAAPTTMGAAPQERRAQQAPHHSIKHGNEQAGRSSLQLGGGSTPAAVTPAVVRCSLQPASSAKLGIPHMHKQARDLPFGAGHVQANLVMDPVTASNKQKNLDDRGKLQTRTQAPEAPDNTQTTTTGQYTHSTLLKSSNRSMSAARRRQGQQLYAWHGTPSRRPQAAPPFPLTPAGEVIQPPPPALPPEAWPC